jgi:hypothetical protein
MKIWVVNTKEPNISVYNIRLYKLNCFADATKVMKEATYFISIPTEANDQLLMSFMIIISALLCV